MRKKEFIVWRWANPSKHFTPIRTLSWGNQEYNSHNFVVFAGLNPTDWLWKARKGVLHKIKLTEEQASQCLVAEQQFRLSDKEINEYIEQTGSRHIRDLEIEQYIKSFILLTKYQGGYIQPEVLIPFEVDAEIDWFRTYWLRFKKQFINPNFKSPPSSYS